MQAGGELELQEAEAPEVVAAADAKAAEAERKAAKLAAMKAKMEALGLPTGD